MVVVKDVYDTLHSKIMNKGITMMFIGYSPLHSSHVFHMFNLKNKGVITTRDVTWLNTTYGKWKGIENPLADLPVYELRNRTIPPEEQ